MKQTGGTVASRGQSQETQGTVSVPPRYNQGKKEKRLFPFFCFLVLQLSSNTA